MKHSRKHITIVFVIVLPIIFELMSMWLCKGNVVVDSLIFTGFECVEAYSPNMTLKSNQCVLGDSLYTVFCDSVDYEIFIDSKQIVKDTLYYIPDNGPLDTVVRDGCYSLCRNSYWISPGKHTLTINSKVLNVSYVYTFHCFPFITLCVESSREAPYFIMHKSFLPLKRKML